MKSQKEMLMLHMSLSKFCPTFSFLSSWEPLGTVNLSALLLEIVEQPNVMLKKIAVLEKPRLQMLGDSCLKKMDISTFWRTRSVSDSSTRRGDMLSSSNAKYVGKGNIDKLGFL